MDGKPSGPGPGQGDPQGELQNGADEVQQETFGPVELTRMRKDDGRALLVFNRPSDR